MKSRFAPLAAVLLALALAGCQSGESPAPEPPPAPEPEAAAAPPPPPAAEVPLTVTSRVLNLREEPSAKSAPLGQLKKGDRVLSLSSISSARFLLVFGPFSGSKVISTDPSDI